MGRQRESETPYNVCLALSTVNEVVYLQPFSQQQAMEVDFSPDNGRGEDFHDIDSLLAEHQAKHPFLRHPRVRFPSSSTQTTDPTPRNSLATSNQTSPRLAFLLESNPAR